MGVTGGSKVFAHEDVERQNLKQLHSKFAVPIMQALSV